MKNFSISRLSRIVLTQRKLLDLTQQALADKAGINRSMLCRLENQDYVPSLDQLTRLANVLEFDVADVFIEYNAPVFNPVVSRNITVFGAGCVGLALATLLARHHKVTVVDIVPEKVRMINQRVSPIRDEYIERHFARAKLDLTATLDGNAACRNADYVIIAVPTGFDPEKRCFDTAGVEAVIRTILQNAPAATIVIRSDVPVGYTASVRRKFSAENILYSPEFLRESSALYDNLYPSRIIVGCDDATRDRARDFAEILKNGALKKDVESLLMGITEAEAVRLFSDACLSQRISFFNELDTYTRTRGMNTRDIIRGICLDPRIGVYGNNPSFGCGGSSLPASPDPLIPGFENIPWNITSAIAESDRIRMDYIAGQVLEMAGAGDGGGYRKGSRETKTVIGVFRLDTDNEDKFRQSSIWGIIKRLRGYGATMILYGPTLEDGSSFFGCRVVNDLRKFKKQSNLIVADRCDPCLDDVADRVYSRDLFRDG